MYTRRILPAITATTGLVGYPFIFYDRFNTDAASPLAATVAANPGPGTWTNTTDTNHKHSISGGKFIIAASGASGAYHGLWSGAYAHAPGRMYFGTTVADGGIPRIRMGLTFSGTEFGSNEGRVIGGAAVGEIYTSGMLGFIRSQTGFQYVINYPTKRLEWVSDTSVLETRPIGMSLCTWDSQAGQFEDAFIADLAAPWTTDFGIATEYDLTADAGTILAGTLADALIEATWQAATGTTLNLMFRRTDDDNCYVVRCDQATGTIKLIKIEEGTETELDTDTQTWTNGTKYRIVVRAVGTIIQAWVGVTIKASTTANTFNQTTTGAKVDLAVEKFIAWPSLITGGALTALEAPFRTS